MQSPCRLPLESPEYGHSCDAFIWATHLVPVPALNIWGLIKKSRGGSLSAVVIHTTIVMRNLDWTKAFWPVDERRGCKPSKWVLGVLPITFFGMRTTKNNPLEKKQ